MDEASKGRGAYLAYISEGLNTSAPQSVIAGIILQAYTQSHSAEEFSCQASLILDALDD